MENSMDDVKKRVGENFEQIKDQLGDRTQELRETIGSFVEEQPLAAVGVAFGLGYLLSGALFSRTTFKAASMGGKFVLGGFLKQLVAGVGPGFLMAAMGRGGEEGGEQQSQSRAQSSQSKSQSQPRKGGNGGNGGTSGGSGTGGIQ
ncbi:MAG: hypothetical protein JWN44_7018 [Myxococcales bacterium]|nr:hypothetical protein [Myxococcales bacterium]